MSRGPDAMTALGRALEASAARAGVAMTIGRRQSTAWSSATFEGSRLRFAIEAPCTDALRAWLAALPDAEWRLPGHLVADICATERQEAAGRATVSLEALTLIEG